MENLTSRELGAVLAGLRLVQEATIRSDAREVSVVDEVGDGIYDILTNGGEFDPLSPSEIDTLCQELNR